MGAKPNDSHKHRRHSSDSGRSSSTTGTSQGNQPLEDTASELISPRPNRDCGHEDPIVPNSHVGSGISDARVAGADDISDGSRPGTPLFDERPETEHTSTASNSNTTPGTNKDDASFAPISCTRLATTSYLKS